MDRAARLVGVGVVGMGMAVSANLDSPQAVGTEMVTSLFAGEGHVTTAHPFARAWPARRRRQNHPTARFLHPPNARGVSRKTGIVRPTCAALAL
jgi:hypothetical protein